MVAMARSYKQTKNLLLLKMIGIALIPIIFSLLPMDYFDNSKYTICLIKNLTGEDCPACGLTRASMHLIHFDLEGALKYNKLVLISLPVASLFLAVEFFKAFRAYKSLTPNAEQETA